MSFTIKFDTSVAGVQDKDIYIQILSNNNGCWDFSTNQWDPTTHTATATNQPQASFTTLDQIGSGGVTLSAFSGGARIYVSIGSATNAYYGLDANNAPAIYAAIYNSKKWKANNVFDKLEFGGDAGSIVNQTAVDFYSLPLYFTIDNGSGEAGYIASRKKIMNQMDKQMKSPYKELLIKDKTGKHTIGVLNPATGQLPFAKSFGQSSTILDSYIKKLLPKSKTLYVGTNKISGKKVQEFNTDKNRNITSTDSGDTANIAFDCFSTFSVFCNAPQGPAPASMGKYNLFGAISAQILRGLSFENNDPTYFSNLEKFKYPKDKFAKILHDDNNSKNGLAYAMGYDDTGAADFSSSLPRPSGVGFTIKLQDCSDLKKILGL